MVAGLDLVSYALSFLFFERGHADLLGEVDREGEIKRGNREREREQREKTL